MLDDAALALEEIEPKDKTRTEVLGARVVMYIAAKKWDMAAAVASHLVKVEPENEAWWISLAYSVRRSEGIEQAEAILLRAQATHPKVAMIAFNLACYASVRGRMEDAKERLRNAIDLWAAVTLAPYNYLNKAGGGVVWEDGEKCRGVDQRAAEFRHPTPGRYLTEVNYLPKRPQFNT